MTAVFVDSSALLRLMFNEPGAKDIETCLASSDPVLSSDVLILEAERAIRRIGINSPGLMTTAKEKLKRFAQLCTIVHLTPEMIATAGEYEQPRLRTLDAIHLATFDHLQKHYPSLKLVTCDTVLKNVVEQERGESSTADLPERFDGPSPSSS